MEFSPISDRIAQFRERVRDRVIRFDTEHSQIVTEEFKKCVSMVPTMHRPMLLKAVAEKRTVRVEDDDVLVANNGRFFSSSVHPCGAERGLRLDRERHPEG
jgi:hypothetical protein